MPSRSASRSAGAPAATTLHGPDPRGPDPRAVVRAELARTLVAAAAVPFHALAYLARRRRHVAELREALAAPGAVPVERALDPAALERARASRRELAVFVSCAEASGETHAVSFVRELRDVLREHGLPPARFVGLGGARLAAEGVELVANPVERAVMGIKDVSGSLGFYLDVLRRCAACVRERRIDVCVPVDSPALHVPLARVLARYGVPTVHFVAPQYWGWLPWRASLYARSIERALTILPFEPGWFARRGVRVAHVGHPLLDALVGVPARAADGEERSLVLLAGSRTSVIERNLPWMLERVAAVHPQVGALEVVVAQADPSRRERLAAIVARHAAALPVRLSFGALHEELARARAVLSVSGTVLLDVLHHRVPMVVVYRLAGAREAWLGRNFITAPWFASINLLANEELVPEFGFHGEGDTGAVERALVRACRDETWRAHCRAGLERAAQRLGPPGAARRAALEVLDVTLSRHSASMGTHGPA